MHTTSHTVLYGCVYVRTYASKCMCTYIYREICTYLCIYVYIYVCVHTSCIYLYMPYMAKTNQYKATTKVLLLAILLLSWTEYHEMDSEASARGCY